MSFFYLSILLSFLIGIAIIAKLRSYDIYEKETFLSMFSAFVIGGGVSVIISLLFYSVFGYLGLSDQMIRTTLGSFVIIGPVEEFSKLAGLVVVFSIMKKQFNEVNDGVIYISCVALGFSIIENFFYANSGNNHEYLLVFRAFISTPAHISCSCLMGYAFYRYKKENKPFKVILYALIIAALLHGIFDALAFSRYIRLFLLIYLWAIIYQSLMLLQYTNIVSPYKPVFDKLFETPDEHGVPDMECPFCKSRGYKDRFTNTYFTAYKCNDCGFHFSTLKHLEGIFRSFAPEYRRFRRKIFPVKLHDGKRYLSVYGTAFFENEAHMGFFRVADVNERMNLINQTLVERFRKVSLIPESILARILGQENT